MKSLTKIHYGSNAGRESAAIAHIEVPKINASDAVVIVDTSNIVPQNAFFEKDVEVILEGSDPNFFVDKGGFRISDEVSSAGNPFYYRHDLKFDIFGAGNDGTADVVVIDSTGNQIPSTLWKYDCSRRSIVHSLSPEAIGNDTVYFVIYPRADGSGNLIDQQHRELLTGNPLFNPAEAKDLLIGCLNPDSDAYILEERDGQPYYWRLTLPRPGTFYLRYTDEGLLNLSIPQEKQSEPWYVEINNAVVLTTQLRLDALLRYNIAEFDLQTFYPFPPIRLVTERQARVLENQVLDVGTGNLVVTVKTPVDVRIYNSSNRLVRAMTTDETKLGQTILGLSWEVNAIKTIDTHSGRVHLDDIVQDGERALVSFYHQEDSYRYTGYNFNPLFNPDALSERVALLVRPSVLPCNETLSHVVISRNEIILSASDTDIADWLLTGTKTLDDLKTDWLYIPGVSLDNDNNYLMLGLVNVSLPVAPEEAIVTDARVRGGGVSTNLTKCALQLMPGASQNWDIKKWDGPSEPMRGAILLYLPEAIKNTFTEQEIRARARKFAPAGSHLVIKYYGS